MQFWKRAALRWLRVSGLYWVFPDVGVKWAGGHASVPPALTFKMTFPKSFELVVVLDRPRRLKFNGQSMERFKTIHGRDALACLFDPAATQRESVEVVLRLIVATALEADPTVSVDKLCDAFTPQTLFHFKDALRAHVEGAEANN